MRLKTALLAGLLAIFIASTGFASEYGVYVKVVEKAKGSFDEVTNRVDSALKNAGWEVIGTFDTGVPEGCKFRSRVIVFSSPSYAKTIMANGVKAAFALPLRAGIYEDETGINVAVLNPASINRTMIDETKLDDFSLSVMNSVVDAIASHVPGDAVKKQIGEIRDEGRVGGMGGGDFLDKIEEVYATADSSDSSLRKVSENVKKGILQNKNDWRLIYTLDLSGNGAVIFGVTKTKTEGRAFEIAGEKRSSDSYRFPGLDHNAAFPIEVIVYREGGKVKVVVLDEMYRMKVYFEDAGRWAFIKNMGMPGRIEGEIIDMIKAGLK